MKNGKTEEVTQELPTRYLAVVNRDSGTVRSLGAAAVEKAVAEGFSGAGSVDIRMVTGADVTGTIEAARAAD
jgi:hypothetical protein